MFGIWATVSGGITGTRSAWLKADDGKQATFETREQAEREADRLNREMNNAHSKASFRYVAEEI
jgi:hypothetical protein